MMKRYKKNRGNTFTVILFTSLLIIIISFLIISNIRINNRREEIINRIDILEKEAEILEEKNKDLKAGVSKTMQPEHAEKILREKGLYKKEGEEMVIIIPEEGAEEENKEEERSIWEKILGKIKLRD